MAVHTAHTSPARTCPSLTRNGPTRTGPTRTGTALAPLSFARLSLAPVVLAAVVGLTVTGCSNIERAEPRPRTAAAEFAGPVNLSEMLRGTVVSEAELIGFDDIVVHGYGLVVGLRGTGSRIVAAPVRAQMMAEMSRRGVGSASMGSTISPERLLDSPDTAVVLVEAVIPPGSPRDAVFDVRVSALPESETTSLEGGILWTTELRPMLQPGMPPTGSRQASPIATARGNLFVNPFAEPGSRDAGNLNRRTGMILGGGTATKNMPLKLRLYSSHHGRASAIQQVINTYFPQEPGQREPTARGESGESIVITVPPSYHDRTDEFVQLLRHTSLQPYQVERTVERIKRIVKENPYESHVAAWRWQSIGPRVLPMIQDLYTEAELRPRLAALHVGARLDDPLVINPLLEIARTEEAELRIQAIELLGDMRSEPELLFGLRDLLDDADPMVRIAAYEALERRRTPFVSSVQYPDKFRVDYVRAQTPMIYVTQSKEPKVVVFGYDDRTDVPVELPITFSVWDGRFIVHGNYGDAEIQVYYRRPGDEVGIVHKIKPTLRELVNIMVHRTTIEEPKPGLDLTYSETVNLLWGLTREKYVAATFQSEQDRIMAAVRRYGEELQVETRPEFAELFEMEDRPSGFTPLEPSGDSSTIWPDLLEPPAGSGDTQRR